MTTSSLTGSQVFYQQRNSQAWEGIGN